jgi:hypothetical protein
MMAMLSLWDSSHLEHGLSLVYDGMDRMCVESKFANGKLLRWKVKVPSGVRNERLSIRGLMSELRQRRPVCGNGVKVRSPREQLATIPT